MTRAALLLAGLVATWGGSSVESFSHVPGGQRLPSRTSSRHPPNQQQRGRRSSLARGKRGTTAVVCLRAATTAAVAESADYLENKEALKQDLRDEYASFFDNFESDRYLPDVEFIDPVTSFTGFQNYKKNLDMLGGRSALGNILFKDASIVLHDIEEPGPFRLRTRWTLTVCFKALPWQPVPRFTGISEYTVDDQARVIKQVDYWDSINLVGGRYQKVSALQGVKDFVGQVLPGAPEEDGAGGLLLRRAKDYEVRQSGEGREVVASREFEEAPSEETVEANSAALMTSLSADGLEAAGEPELRSPSPSGANQVSVKLTKHDWMT